MVKKVLFRVLSVLLIISFFITSCNFLDFKVYAVDNEMENTTSEQNPYVNLVQNQTYSINIPASVDYADTGRKLTDGKYDATKNCTGPEWVGFYRATYDPIIIDIIYDLKEVKSINTIKSNFLHDAQYGISYPDFVKYSVSQDGNVYTEVLNEARPDTTLSAETHQYTYNADSAQSVRFVKISFEVGYWYPDQGDGRWWSLLDEVEIIGTDNMNSSETNLALNSAYKFESPTPQYSAPHVNYPDVAKELTDGVFGITSINDDAWQGHLESDGATREIVFDLGYKKGIKAISANFLKNTQGSQMVNFPAKVEYLISQDGSKWESVFVNNNVTSNEPAAISNVLFDVSPNTDTTATSNLLAAQYVKVLFNVNDCALLDEIKVIGTHQPPIDQDSFVNLSKDKEYTMSVAASVYSPDTGRKLTDGRYDTTNNCTSPEWVGFYRATYDPINIDVIFDLRENKQVQEITANFLHDAQYGISYPDIVKFSISENGTDYTEVMHQNRPDTSVASEAFKYSHKAEMTTRYVKVTFEIGYWYPDQGDGKWWSLLDEVEIIGTDASGQPINLASGLDYIFDSSYKASGYDYPNNTYPDESVELSDDRLATTDINDGNWQGHFEADGSSREIVFDLTDKKGVKSIAANFLNNTLGEIKAYVPSKVAFMSSEDGQNWMLLGEKTNIIAKNDPEIIKVYWDIDIDGAANGIQGEVIPAKYVKVIFDINQAAFIDEVVIMGINDSIDAGTPDGVEGLKKISNGLEYTWNQAPSPSYPDKNFELTDGILGGVDVKNPAWAAHYPYIPYINVDFDLKTEKAIGYISANYLFESDNGIVMPGRVKFMVSNDNENWSTVYLEDGIQDPVTDTAITKKFSWNSKNSSDPSLVKARYVRVEYLTGFWTFIDEIEIWGKDDTTDAITLEIDKPSTSTYAKPSEQTSGGISDLVLAYNQHYDDGTGYWTPEQFKPYLTYVDKNNDSIDTMFNGVLFLALNSHQREIVDGKEKWHRFDATHGSTDAIPSNLEDWNWYLDKTFKEGGDVWALNEAAKMAANDLGIADYKANFVVMHPFPDSYQKNFGDIDGDGISEDFSKIEDRKKAVNWYTSEVLKRVTDGNYSNLNFKGLYWINENVSDSDIIKYTSNIVHNNNLKFYWIPYYGTGRIYKWNELGFDVASYQPNHFFHNSDETRVRDCAAMAKDFGMGIEIETGPEILRDEAAYNKYLDYLDGSIKYEYQGPDVFKAYYQHVYGYKLMADSEVEKYRRAYDNTYKMIKGTLKLSNRTKVDAPTAQTVTDHSVALNPVENMEYSMDSWNWQDSNEFTGLQAETQYTFYQRQKETATHDASFASEALVCTTSTSPDVVIPPSKKPTPEKEKELVTTQNKEIDGQKVTVDTINNDVLNNVMNGTQNNSGIDIKADNKSDAILVNINAQSLETMVNKNVMLSISTDDAKYELPAKVIDIEDIKDKIAVTDLSKISLNITIAKSGKTDIEAINKSAKKQNVSVVSAPVDFEISATANDKTIEVDKFSTFVNRYIKLPQNIDLTKNMIGVVKGGDGNLYPVPSNIVDIKGTKYLEMKSLTNSTYSIVSVDRKFNDVEGHWSQNQVISLANRLIISGQSVDSFAPDSYMTRAEFATIIVKALGLQPQGIVKFSDVTSDEWYYGYVGTAVQYGLIQGKTETLFKPMDYISREEVAVIIYRAAKICEMKTEMSASDVESFLTQFEDYSKCSSWSKQALAFNIKNELIGGADMKIMPLKNITRAEAATIIKRMLVKVGLINQ